MKIKVKNDQHVQKQQAIDNQEATSQNDDDDDDEDGPEKESELQSLLNELLSQTDLLERLFDPEKQREEPTSSASLTACHLCGSITNDKDNISSENKNGVSKPTLSPEVYRCIISLIFFPIKIFIRFFLNRVQYYYEHLYSE